MAAARRAVLRPVGKRRGRPRGLVNLMLKEKILESSLGYALWSAPVNRPKIDAIRQMLQKCGKGKVLDVGCGPGTNAEIFADWDYVGIDLNASYIENARSKFPAMRFVH